MISQSLLTFVVFLVLFYDIASMIFPLDDSILETPCKRKDGLNGSAKILQRCLNNSENEFIGVIIGRGNVVCCPESVVPRDIKKSSSNIGNKAKAFCTDQSSTTLSPLVTKIIGGNFSDVGEFPHMAALGFENFEGDLEFKCGAALISHRFLEFSLHGLQLFIFIFIALY